MPENPDADPYLGSDNIYGANNTMATANTHAAASNINNNINNNNRKSSAQSRVSSAGTGYYDIATQLLGKQGPDLEELFIAAARDGLYEKIENFLQRNRNDYVVSIDVKDRKTGNTPLIWAAKRGHAKIVQLLLRHGADITLRNYEGHTAVEVASPTIRAILLESVERSTEASHQLLLQAAWQGDLRVVSRLLSQKKVLDINCQNAEGFTPIMLATRDMHMFERFSTQMSRTYNPAEVVAELMLARADIHASDCDGKTCLHHAAQSKANIANSVVSTIISGGANLEQKDKRCFAPIHCASLTGNAVCITSLLDGGSEVNSRGFAGATPLHITSYNNHEKATTVLLEHGANVTLTDDRGFTPLDFAKTRKMKKRLQEAWVECASSKASPRLGPIRSRSREDLRASIEDLSKRKKGEVIFEGLPSNPFSEASKKDAGSSGKGLTRHQSLKEQSGQGEDDISTPVTPLNNNVRRLGQVRNHKPTPLPRAKSRSTERLPTISPDRSISDRNLESPIMFGRNSRNRRSFEDRQGRGRVVPMSTRDRIAAIADEVFDRNAEGRQSPNPRMQQHRRAESDGSRSTPNLLDIAASCNNLLQSTGRRGRSFSVNSPANDLTSDAKYQNVLQRESTVSSLQREMTLSVQRETTLMSVCSTRTDSRMSNNPNSPRLLNLGQMLCKSKTPVQNMPLYGPGSSKIIPPTPTFLTQRTPSSLEATRNESDTSPRSEDDDRPEFVRTKTIFKEEFVLEESRPKDPFMQCSSGSCGSDTVSSSSSSHQTPSPRETTPFLLVPKSGASSNKQFTRPSVPQGRSATAASAKSAKYIAEPVSAKVTTAKVNDKVTGKDAKRANEKSDFVGVKVKVKQESKTGSKIAAVNELERETSFADAIAKQRASEANAASKHASTKQKSKQGGTIVVHAETNKVINSGNVSNDNTSKNVRPESVNCVPQSVQCNETSKPDNGEVKPLTSTKNAVSGSSNGSALKSNSGGGSKTPVQSRKQITQKQKMQSVLQVIPTKLTENIIRTAPKASKDKVDDTSFAAKNGPLKEEEVTEPVQAKNVNMQLSPSAHIVTRCANQKATDPASEKKSVQSDVNNKAAADAKIASKSETKTVGQTGSVSKAGRSASSAAMPSRLGAQSRNSNMNVSRSANVPQRQNASVKKPLSSYTPRFGSNLATKSDSAQTAKVGSTDKKQEELNLHIKMPQSSDVQGNTLNTGGSPTELVPSTVCRNSSLAKSYNMASNSNIKSKSANNVSATTVTPTMSSSPAAVANVSQSNASSKTSVQKRNDVVSKSTSEAVLGSAKLTSASIVSKSISQMPGVGNVANKAGITRSSSMSVIEEANEQKKMSSSDTRIVINPNVKPKRPLSDGNDPKDGHNAPLLPVDSTAPRVSYRNYQNVNTLVSTPVIVNPFEELEKKRAAENIERAVTATEFGFVVERPCAERSKTQTSIKSKSSTKSVKKSVTTNPKTTVSGTRGSSARRKRPRTKDSNKSDSENRPKSGKSTKGRARSGRRRKKSQQDSNLAKENEKSDVALIGGIGWHLQTSCLDKSDADAVVVSAITSSESESEDLESVRMASPLSVKIPNNNLQIPNAIESHSSLTSPRFREIRPSFEEKPEILPYMEDDGFPPMNLDMTQQNRSGVFIADIPDDISEFLAKLKENDNNEQEYDELSDSSADDSSESHGKVDINPALYHNEALVGKLTPIPESPATTHNSSALLKVAKTVEAIKKFDENVQDDDLNRLLGATPRDKAGSAHTSVSLEKGNVISIRTNLRTNGSGRSSVQSKDSKAAVMGSAGSRGVSSISSRNSSSRTNQSRNASLSSANTLERSSGKSAKQQLSPQAKSSGESVNDQQKRNVLSMSAGSVNDKVAKEQNVNDSQKSKVKSAERKEGAQGSLRKDNQTEIQEKEGMKLDLKELLAEKMKTTEKMLHENVTEKNRARKNSVGQDDSVNDRNTDNCKKDSKNLTVPNLDIGNLDSGRSDDEGRSTRSSTRRERKYSETKVEQDRDDDIQEAIEEIMTNTFPSRKSSRSRNVSLRSASSTLTEADTKLLKQMIQNNSASPFHARESNVRVSSSYDDSVTLNRDNPDLMKRFHADNLKLGQKVKAMIDAGADSVKVKAMIKADSETKQLAKIMNSFKQMELYAGPVSHQNRSSKKETPRLPGEEMNSQPVRPGSAGGGKIRTGKFTEIKAATSSASHATHDGPTTPSAVPKDLAEEFRKSRFVRISSQQDMDEEDQAGTLPEDGVLSFERPESACTTTSSNSSVFEETIQWKKGNVLGKGAFGTVWCGLTSEGQLIAVKQIELNTNNHSKAKKEYEKVQEEVELLKTLEHRNIVGYLGTSLEDSIVSIFMQFVPGGSIASILARFGALDESVFRKYTRQILEGVEYLHDNDVIHRDIKGGNVMLMPNGVIKLIDFGCAKRLCINLSMGQSEILKSMKGTPYWMAPEVVNETGHGKKSDIWSVGCTVFEMATRKPPWSDMNPMAAIFAIGSDKPVPQLPDKFSDEALEFVNQCLSRDQGRRPSASELLQSVFIRRRPKKSLASNSSYC